MKKLKKVTAALAAATMVTSCAGVVTSADEVVNAVNVSYSTVAETFTAADGTVVPAGATAVTLSIENNTGFSASDITLNATADLLGVDGIVAAKMAVLMVTLSYLLHRTAVRSLSPAHLWTTPRMTALW